VNALGKLIKCDEQQIKTMVKENEKKYLINPDGTKT